MAGLQIGNDSIGETSFSIKVEERTDEGDSRVDFKPTLQNSTSESCRTSTEGCEFTEVPKLEDRPVESHCRSNVSQSDKRSPKSTEGNETSQTLFELMAVVKEKLGSAIEELDSSTIYTAGQRDRPDTNISSLPSLEVSSCKNFDSIYDQSDSDNKTLRTLEKLSDPLECSRSADTVPSKEPVIEIEAGRRCSGMAELGHLDSNPKHPTETSSTKLDSSHNQDFVDSGHEVLVPCLPKNSDDSLMLESSPDRKFEDLQENEISHDCPKMSEIQEGSLEEQLHLFIIKLKQEEADEPGTDFSSLPSCDGSFSGNLSPLPTDIDNVQNMGDLPSDNSCSLFSDETSKINSREAQCQQSYFVATENEGGKTLGAIKCKQCNASFAAHDCYLKHVMMCQDGSERQMIASKPLDMHRSRKQEINHKKVSKETTRSGKKENKLEDHSVICDLCNTSFKNHHSYEHHFKVKKHDLRFKLKTLRKGEKNSHTCYICDVTCLTKEGLEDHVRRERHIEACKRYAIGSESVELPDTMKPKENFNCKRCNLSFHLESDYKKHLRSSNHIYGKESPQHDTNPSKLTESKRRTDSSQYRSDESHKKITVRVSNKYGEKSPPKGDLRKKLTRQNGSVQYSRERNGTLLRNKDDLFCNICNITLHSDMRLRLHLEGTQHLENKMKERRSRIGLRCEMCAMSFQSDAHLELHMNSRHRENQRSNRSPLRQNSERFCRRQPRSQEETLFESSPRNPKSVNDSFKKEYLPNITVTVNCSTSDKWHSNDRNESSNEIDLDVQRFNQQYFSPTKEFTQTVLTSREVNRYLEHPKESGPFFNSALESPSTMFPHKADEDSFTNSAKRKLSSEFSSDISFSCKRPSSSSFEWNNFPTSLDNRSHPSDKHYFNNDPYNPPKNPEAVFYGKIKPSTVSAQSVQLQSFRDGQLYSSLPHNSRMPSYVAENHHPAEGSYTLRRTNALNSNGREKDHCDLTSRKTMSLALKKQIDMERALLIERLMQLEKRQEKLLKDF